MINIKPFHSPKSIEAESFAIIDAEAGEPKPFSGAAWEIARRMVHSCADFEILEHLHLPDYAIQAGVAALRAGCTIYTDTEMARVGMSRFRLDRLGRNKMEPGEREPDMPEPGEPGEPGELGGGIKVLSVLSLPGVAERAAAQGCTRSRAGVELAWQRCAIQTQQHDQARHAADAVALQPVGAAAFPVHPAGPASGSVSGSIWAFGNAPTALLALLELCAAESGLGDGALPKRRMPSLIVGLPVGFVNAAESKEILLRQNIIPCLTLRGRKGGSTLAAAVINALAELALAD